MSEWWSAWLLWFLGVEVPPTGEGVQWALRGSWNWNRATVVLLVLFMVAAASYVVTIYFRERSSAGRAMRCLLASLRLALILLVVVVMLFELRLQFSRTSLPILALAIDRSASMDTVDDFSDASRASEVARQTSSADFPTASRFNLARSLLLADNGSVLDRLARRYTLAVYSIAGRPQRLSSDLETLSDELRALEPNGDSSQLGVSIRGVLNDLRGSRPAAIVVLTDGITTEGPTLSDIAATARRKAVPLYIVGVGSAEKVQDLELSDLLVDEIVFMNDYVDFDFKLTTHGLEGRTIELVLKDKKTGELLSRASVVAGPDGVGRREQMSYRPTRVGVVDTVIEVTNLKEALKGKTPQVTRQIEVRDDPIRVLLVQGYPSFEYQYLKVLLERDETIDLDVVLQKADLEYAEEDQSALRIVPVRRETLFEYDVIILGDVDLAHLSRSVQKNLAEFVTVKGGGLLIVTGERFEPSGVARTPLAVVMPFEMDRVEVAEVSIDVIEGFRLRPTLLGLTSAHMQLGDTRSETASIWSQLPEMYGLLEVAELKPGARVLAEHPTRTGRGGGRLPVMVSYYVPPGKVLWHGFDESYRWRFRVGDALFARYWVQAIRYLSRSKMIGDKQVELASDKREYPRGTPIQLRVRFFDERLAPAADEGVTVLVEGTSPGQHRVTLRRSASSRAIFEGDVATLPVGDYRAWIVKPNLEKMPAAIRFQVASPPGESARREIDVADMKKAATRSRGRYFDASSAKEVFLDLPNGRQVKIASMPPIVLWNNWRVLLLFLVLLLTEWLLRKRKGML